MKPHADVLLVTVTKVETVAVLDAFREATRRAPTVRPMADKTCHDLGDVNGARVWLVRSEMGAGGLGAAQQAITKALAALKPQAVIMVGIAFGTRPGQQHIGDVLVSQRLAPYELQWVGTVEGQPKIVPFGARPDASPWLLDRLRAAELSWRPATVHFGLVLTGEKLVDNLEFRRRLCALESDGIGGEMEGAGFYVACHDAKVDWILVKGICDWADGDKEADREARQALAARNAACFVLHTLQQAPLKRETPPPEPGAERSSLTISQSGSGGLAVGKKNVVAGQGGIAIGGDFKGNLTTN